MLLTKISVEDCRNYYVGPSNLNFKMINVSIKYQVIFSVCECFYKKAFTKLVGSSTVGRSTKMYVCAVLCCALLDCTFTHCLV